MKFNGLKPSNRLMINSNVLSGILTHFAVQLPVVIVCLAAGIITLNRWNRRRPPPVGRSSVWAWLC